MAGDFNIDVGPAKGSTRLDRLEADYLRLRRVCRGLVVVLAVVTLMTILGMLGGKSPDQPTVLRNEIEAGRFVLKDRDGNTRGDFAVEESGQPALTLSGAHEKSSIRLAMDGHDSDFPTMVFRDPAGHKRLHVAISKVSPEGRYSPSVTFYDGKESPAIELVQNPDSGNFLCIYRWPGRAFVQAGLMSDGSPRVELADPDGDVIAELPQKP